MENNITEQQYFDGNLPLAEPHFNEEATVAAARPVVPLQEIATKARSKRLIFGLSILVALMVGALGATLIYKQRAQNPVTAITDAAVTGSGASGEQTMNPASMTEAKAGGGAAVGAEKEDDALVADQKPKPQVAPRMVPARARPVQEKPLSRADEKEMRRLERIEERRLRNIEEREARRESRRRRKSNDLLRIREIFEGSPRP